MEHLQRDTALIEAAIAGDVRARETLLRAWLPQLISWCKRLSGPKVDPEDIFQDVAEKVLTKMHTLREPAALPGWLYQVVRSQANRRRRKAWLRRWASGAEPTAVDTSASPERSARLSEISVQVQEVLERMPEKQREVLILCFLEDRSQSEVADMLGVPLGTVKSRIRLARERFAKEAARISPHLADVTPLPPSRLENATGGP
ncbi:MAG: sigma-70 family RNA polymerase sigma factor [Alphaproteobacteria bacterium]|nr:sigma-70 family RNA polymerase sigma factor [Alphaproteobacteria bacterium]